MGIEKSAQKNSQIIPENDAKFNDVYDMIFLDEWRDNSC